MRKWLSCLIPLFLCAEFALAQGVTVLQRSDKTELADPFSVVAAVGGEFGLPTLWWWHRINAGWGSVRREVAQLYVSDPAEGVVFSLQGGNRTWNPNHLHEQVDMERLRFSEDKFVDQDAIADSLEILNLSGEARKLRLYFVGKSEGRCRISFDKARNRVILAETKDYGPRYPPGPFVVYQEMAFSAPITGWGIGGAMGDLQKLMEGPLGFGVFTDDSNVRKYVTDYEGSGYYYGIQLDINLPARQSSNLNLSSAFGRDPARTAMQSDRLIRDPGPILQQKTSQLLDHIANDWP